MTHGGRVKTSCHYNHVRVMTSRAERCWEGARRGSGNRRSHACAPLSSRRLALSRLCAKSDLLCLPARIARRSLSQPALADPHSHSSLSSKDLIKRFFLHFLAHAGAFGTVEAGSV